MLVLLVLLDQLSKLLISRYFMTAHWSGQFIGFAPVLNRAHQSIYNQLFNWHVPLFVLVLINLLVLIVFGSVFLFFRHEQRMTPLRQIYFNCLLSAALCSLLDKVFWGGSLDFIRWQHYIYDLKDVYLTAAEVLIVIDLVKNWSRIRQLSDRVRLQHYWRFLKENKSTHLLKKKK